VDGADGAEGSKDKIRKKFWNFSFIAVITNCSTRWILSIFSHYSNNPIQIW